MKIMTNQNDCRGKFTLFLVALVILWGHQPGFSETQDIEQLRQAAEQGDAETQFSLGRIYSLGRGVPSGQQRGREVVSPGGRAGTRQGPNHAGPHVRQR